MLTLRTLTTPRFLLLDVAQGGQQAGGTQGQAGWPRLITAPSL